MTPITTASAIVTKATLTATYYTLALVVVAIETVTLEKLRILPR